MPVAEQTIAIVDDDVRFNRALERLLRASGFETNTFGSAEEFLANHTPQSHAHHGRTVLVLNDRGGEPLDRLLERPLELVSSLRIAAGLATALAGLHARGLIHKDIKPANILVDPVTSRVWLTGFSIASDLPRERQAPEPPETNSTCR